MLWLIEFKRFIIDRNEKKPLAIPSKRFSMSNDREVIWIL